MVESETISQCPKQQAWLITNLNGMLSFKVSQFVRRNKCYVQLSVIVILQTSVLAWSVCFVSAKYIFKYILAIYLKSRDSKINGLLDLLDSPFLN